MEGREDLYNIGNAGKENLFSVLAGSEPHLIEQKVVKVVDIDEIETLPEHVCEQKVTYEKEGKNFVITYVIKYKDYRGKLAAEQSDITSCDGCKRKVMKDFTVEGGCHLGFCSRKSLCKECAKCLRFKRAKEDEDQDYYCRYHFSFLFFPLCLQWCCKQLAFIWE